MNNMRKELICHSSLPYMAERPCFFEHPVQHTVNMAVVGFSLN